jgi:hypothetical protein
MRVREAVLQIGDPPGIGLVTKRLHALRPADR